MYVEVLMDTELNGSFASHLPPRGSAASFPPSEYSYPSPFGGILPSHPLHPRTTVLNLNRVNPTFAFYPALLRNSPQPIHSSVEPLTASIPHQRYSTFFSVSVVQPSKEVSMTNNGSHLTNSSLPTLHRNSFFDLF